MKKINPFILAIPVIFLLALATAGCVARIGPPAVGIEVEGDVTTYYDDPARGWFVEGYWTGDCLNCGFWVAPFWTTDILILHEHFPHYRGSHRGHIEQHYNRHPERFRGHPGQRDQHPGVRPSQPPTKQPQRPPQINHHQERFRGHPPGHSPQPQQHPQVNPPSRPSPPAKQPPTKQPPRPPQKRCLPNQKC